jgi:hypothetical protein
LGFCRPPKSSRLPRSSRNVDNAIADRSTVRGARLAPHRVLQAESPESSTSSPHRFPGSVPPSSNDGRLASNFFCASRHALVTQSRNPLMTAVLRHLPVRADQTQRFETSAPHQGPETGDEVSNAASGMDRVV